MNAALDHTEQSEAGAGARERALLALVGELARELHPQHSRSEDISLSSRLERDLGIDSLGRTELILRLERGFGVRLPIGLVGAANTVGDLLARACSKPFRRARGSAPMTPSRPMAAVRAATEARTLIDVLQRHVAEHPDRTARHGAGGRRKSSGR